MGGQLRLSLEHNADFSRERLVVSTPNSEAVRTLDTWPDGRGGALALIGPAGAGKTHLATAWAHRTGAGVINPAALSADQQVPASGAWLWDGADVAAHDEAFFHLLNMAARQEGCLLLTGRTTPGAWPVQVPDLRSRLNALPVIQLWEPDDVILRGVLVKLFQERNIRPLDLLTYLLLRMERSVPAAQAIVLALDEAASAENRAVSRSLARELLLDDKDDSEG